MSSASTDWSQTPVWAAPAPLAAPPDTGPPPIRRRRRRRRIRRAALALVVVVVAVVAAERAGRSYASGEIASRLRDGGVSGDVHVTVGRSWWRPSVLPALLTGDLDRVTIEIRDGTLSGIPVERAEYVLDDINGDVSLRHGTVAVRSVGGGSVLVRIPPEAIGASIGLDVGIRDGRLVAGDPPTELRAQVVGDSLVLSGPALRDRGRPQALPVADPYLLPCHPDARIVDGAVQLACTGDRLPGILRVPLQGTVTAPAGTVPVDVLPPPQTTERGGG